MMFRKLVELTFKGVLTRVSASMQQEQSRAPAPHGVDDSVAMDRYSAPLGTPHHGMRPWSGNTSEPQRQTQKLCLVLQRAPLSDRQPVRCEFAIA
jgi:hypothetical protein